MTQKGRLVLNSSPATDMLPEDGIVLGKALAADNHTVVVSRDLMRSSAMMANAVMSGLLFQGANVVDAGVLSAPAAALAASKGDCGVYVAGRPDSNSGFWLFNKDGRLFRDDQIRHLDIVLQTLPDAPGHDALGTYRKTTTATEEYNRMISGKMDGGLKCSAVLDCSCGTTADSLTSVLGSMDADIVMINAQPDPAYVPEWDQDGVPKVLGNYIRSNPGNIGIRLNGAGTRVDIIDESGAIVPMATVFALLVMYLKPSTIAVTADSTSLIEDAFNGAIETDIVSLFEACPEDERKVIVTRDNAASVSEAVANGAELGYNHGTIIFGKGVPIGDGILASALIAHMAGDNSIHRLAESLPEYFSDRTTVKCPIKADAYRRAMDENLGDLAEKCIRYGDSYKVVMDEGWFVARHATGPDDSFSVEILAESRDRAYLVGLMEVAGELVEAALRGH